MLCPDFNCTDTGYPIEFDADPDIAGIGVILAFLISAWATFLFVIITFFFVERFNDGSKNRLDGRIVDRTREFKKTYIRPVLPQLLKIDRPFSFDAIEKIAFTLSDQQLVTGISIYIVGFARHCMITQYHFYVVFLLGILSFSTHQSTMMIVKKKLRDNHWMRWWRLAAIFLIFAFSFVANIPVSNSYFFAEAGLVMQCVWSILPRYYIPGQIVILTVTSILLAWGFVEIAQDIYPEAGKKIGNLLMPIGNFLNPFLQPFSPWKWQSSTRRRLAQARQKQRNEWIWWLIDWFAFIFFLVCFTIIEVLTSRIADLYRVWATLFFATYEVLSVGKSVAGATTLDGNPALVGNENTWGFGQILPMLLLALPLAQVWEMVWEDIVGRRKELVRRINAEQSKTPSTASSQNGNIPMNTIPGTSHTSQAPLRQEIGKYYGLSPETTREGIELNLQRSEDTNVNGINTLEDRDRQESFTPPENPPGVQREPRSITIERVNTVNLERQPIKHQATSSGDSISNRADEPKVEDELYNSLWFWIWLWVWILGFFGVTTYGATRGLIF